MIEVGEPGVGTGARPAVPTALGAGATVLALRHS